MLKIIESYISLIGNTRFWHYRHYAILRLVLHDLFTKCQSGICKTSRMPFYVCFNPNWWFKYTPKTYRTKMQSIIVNHPRWIIYRLFQDFNTKCMLKTHKEFTSPNRNYLHTLKSCCVTTNITRQKIELSSTELLSHDLFFYFLCLNT